MNILATICLVGFTQFAFRGLAQLHFWKTIIVLQYVLTRTPRGSYNGVPLQRNLSTQCWHLHANPYSRILYIDIIIRESCSQRTYSANDLFSLGFSWETHKILVDIYYHNKTLCISARENVNKKGKLLKKNADLWDIAGFFHTSGTR